MSDTTTLGLRVPAATAQAFDTPAVENSLVDAFTKALDSPFFPLTATRATGVVLEWLSDHLTVDRPHPADQSPALTLLAAERAHHRTAGHDDQADDAMTDGELLDMAGWHLIPTATHDDWPWDDEPPPRGDRLHELVRAAALIAAEIDRLTRAGTGED